MNRQNSSSGWEIQPDDEEAPSSGEREATTWLREDLRPLLGLLAVLLVFAGFLVLAPDLSKTPAYEVPGGQIEKLTPDKLSEWIQVTDRLAERQKNLDRPINPGWTLFTYFDELGKRDDLKRIVTDVCRKELITFEQYRNITHEIALTSPFRTIEESPAQNEDAGEVQVDVSDEKLKRIRNNRRVISERLSDVKRVWNDLRKPAVARDKQEDSSTKSGPEWLDDLPDS